MAEWVKVTDIKPGWYIHRWGDWLKVLDVEDDGQQIIFTCFDHNPQGNPDRPRWEFHKNAELIAAPDLDGTDDTK